MEWCDGKWEWKDYILYEWCNVVVFVCLGWCDCVW